LIGDGWVAEDIAFDNFGVRSFGNIADSRWQDGVAVVGTAVSREESDETLCSVPQVSQMGCVRGGLQAMGKQLTVNAAIWRSNEEWQRGYVTEEYLRRSVKVFQKKSC